MSFKANLEDISDGKLYDYNDMVKSDTRGCNDCSACCHHMNETIVLNPYDMYVLTTGLKTSFDELLDEKIGLHMDGRLKLPHLLMVGKTEACAFLSEEGWCEIHGLRPDLCRLFPLGRVYQGDEVKFVFKEGDCVMTDLSKIKVKKWVNIKNYASNKSFLLQWFNFIKALKFRMKFADEAECVEIQDYIIDVFYNIKANSDEAFYTAFEKRIAIAKNKLGVL